MKIGMINIRLNIGLKSNYLDAKLVSLYQTNCLLRQTSEQILTLCYPQLYLPVYIPVAKYLDWKNRKGTFCLHFKAHHTKFEMKTPTCFQQCYYPLSALHYTYC